MPPTGDETSSSSSNGGESAHEDATKVKDLLLSETLPLYQGENSGIKLAKESEEKIDTESIRQTPGAQTPPTGQISAPTTPQITNVVHEPLGNQ